jgi:drug/metabolite transporter (DMT)-like permease
MRTGGWVGAFTGGAIVRMFTDQYQESNTVGALAGATLGLTVGDRMVHKTDFSFGQSVIVDLTSIGGGLLGLGTSMLARGSSGSEKVQWAASAAGTVVGYTVGYVMYAKAARRAEADRSAWRFDVMPSPPSRNGGMPGVMLTMSTVLR